MIEFFFEKIDSLFFLNVFKYTSSSSVISGGNVTWDEGVSLYNFLFNGDLLVVYDKIEYIREILPFSCVIMWISFIGMLVSLGISIFGIFHKKGWFSKIGNIILMICLSILILISFEVETVVNTSKYLSVITPGYFICLVVGGLGVFSTITLKNK